MISLLLSPLRSCVFSSPLCGFLPWAWRCCLSSIQCVYKEWVLFYILLFSCLLFSYMSLLPQFGVAVSPVSLFSPFLSSVLLSLLFYLTLFYKSGGVISPQLHRCVSEVACFLLCCFNISFSSFVAFLPSCLFYCTTLFFLIFFLLYSVHFCLLSLLLYSCHSL